MDGRRGADQMTAMALSPPDRPLEGRTILQVTPALDAGGVEQTTLDVAEAIVLAGGRALVASAGGRLEGELARRGGRLVRMPVDSKNPLTVFANAARLVRLIEAEAVDLVHVRSRAPAFSAQLAVQRTGVPMLTTYHGVYNARSALKRWYNGVMTRGDLTIANSDYTRAHAIAEHGVDPDKVFSIPRGVDLRRFDPALVPARRVAAMRKAWGMGAGETRPVLLLAGRLTRWKGQALMIEALARLRQRGRAAILVLAGDDQGRSDYSTELKAQAEAAVLGDAVRFAGHVEDMPAAYLAADLVVVPSLDPEAFGRTAVEPQAMGRPVLAADHGALTETVVDGQTGWLIPPGDADAWATALGQALDAGPERWSALGQAGRQRAASLYSLDQMTARTLAVYGRLLKGLA
jgi:glycosyltransferase involved in cell wall biosynthesis